MKPSLTPLHQAVFDACVVAGPLLDIVRESNRYGKLRKLGLIPMSPAQVVRILDNLRAANLVAQTDNGTWFAPVTPKEEKLARDLNMKAKTVIPGESLGDYLRRTIPEDLQIKPDDRLFKEAGQ